MRSQGRPRLRMTASVTTAGASQTMTSRLKFSPIMVRWTCLSLVTAAIVARFGSESNACISHSNDCCTSGTTGMVPAARRSCSRQQGIANVRFVVGDIHEPAPEGPVDAIVCRYVLMYVPDPATVLKAQAAPLCSGGLVVPIEQLRQPRAIQPSDRLLLPGRRLPQVRLPGRPRPAADPKSRTCIPGEMRPCRLSRSSSFSAAFIRAWQSLSRPSRRRSQPAGVNCYFLSLPPGRSWDAGRWAGNGITPQPNTRLDGPMFANLAAGRPACRVAGRLNMEP
jgi:Methyltransferase domain